MDVPMRNPLTIIRERRRELTEIALVTIAFFIYFGVRGLVVERIPEAEYHAEKLISLEKWLGIYWEPHLQDFFLVAGWVRRIANGIYLYGHGPVIGVTAVLLYTRNRRIYLLTRNTFLLSGAIGLIIYYAFPVAPPRLVPGSDFVDTVLQEYHVRRVLMPHFLMNEYAAVPSLHFGWNLVMGVAIWHAFPNRYARTFAVAMPTLMLMAIIVTANHFILDSVAGTLVVALGAILAIGARNFGGRYFQRDSALDEGARWILGVFGSPKRASHGVGGAPPRGGTDSGDASALEHGRVDEAEDKVKHDAADHDAKRDVEASGEESHAQQLASLIAGLA